MAPPLARLFIALYIPGEVAPAVAETQRQVEAIDTLKARYTKRQHLHLTLKFFGEQPKYKINTISAALDKVRAKSFTASLGKVGTFSEGGPIRIIWMHVDGEGVLDLQRQIDYNLDELFKPEERFMSHLTIARAKQVRDRAELVEKLAAIPAPGDTFTVDEFHLIQSQLSPDGPIYTRLNTFSLT